MNFKRITLLSDKAAQDWCEEKGIARAMREHMSRDRKINWMHGSVAIRRWGNEPKQIALAVLYEGFEKSENNGWAVYIIDKIAEGELPEAISILKELENDMRETGRNSMSALLN